MSPGETHCAFVAYQKRRKNEQDQEGIHHYNLMNALRFIATDIFNALRKHSRKKPEQLWKLPYEHLLKKPKKNRQSRTEEDYLKILSHERKKKKKK